MTNQLLTIKLDGKDGRISVDSFLTLTGETMRILCSIDRRALDSNRGAIVWNIEEISKSSPLSLTIRGEQLGDVKQDIDIVRVFLESVETMNARPERKQLFPRENLDNLKHIVTLLDDGVGSIVFSAGEKTVRPTQHIAANIDALSDRHSEWTTIDGRLEMVTAHRKREFRVYDRLTGESVVCTFKKDMEELVRDGLLRRVVVSGEARYQFGRPHRINVESMQVLRDAGIRYDDLPPINITDGLSAAEYVRRLRDGE